MQFFLRLSRGIDWLTEKIGNAIIWLVLAAALISAGNAVLRKAFNIGSNAWLEMQWYLFAAVFLLGAGYTFLHNGHVRIDFLSSRLSARTCNVIDIVGIAAVIGPLCWMVIELAWPLVMNALASGERSPNAGGLIRWPVFMLLPLGMALLLMQAASELIKRIAFLRGLIPDPLAHKDPGQQHGEQTVQTNAPAGAGK